MSLPFYLSYAALWVIVILNTLLLLGVVRMVYQLQHSGGDGKLKPGEEAPPFRAVDLAGTPVRSADFAGRLTALLFVSPTCPSCTTTLAEMDALRYKAQGNVIVICRAGRDDCARLAARHQLNVPTIADEDEEISRLFDISSVPTAVLINAGGRIQSYGNPMRGEDLEALFSQAPAPEAQEVG
ncbi:MAG TPA: redoxin domain-containing protein [Thermomicrobiales bacterium]|nr:redoxin domain-containing protein [Thermomicrobiales bacterium]